MLILADTGILLRLLEPADPQHTAVRDALRILRQRGHRRVTAPQNASEFWNVCTRPVTARGGFGLSVPEADRRLRIVERLFQVLPDSLAVYAAWRRIIVAHAVMGVPRGDRDNPQLGHHITPVSLKHLNWPPFLGRTA